ncbi:MULTISPECIES: tRNA uridine-5-carboxymethylaminomethyl(34) synthesis enzyme MnmG [unclassified Meiothermus]|uniref:tRNA uridine-5-carboxymethylaminomethyl(34) synthesis enzyme MnmG n=1 Tax=unclassified Meiothermus TaxID=370471 RepID=UPI000D7C6977|nr:MULTISPECIES: tRNA uridine-5-carboxymethylaminomethyl(34) synthesis enzyme MnmG [unclassified Meiothermus]PZA05880.1 tRNA uridine-5-carboxymethylaminomethyl(34) synthesis enzyme MnmG [Meiothermus sp. Pnk-1]RYM29421.1 tRNA uridine-5-carboxymethylaminomethyl(34) synthesis enzyme MnmG [Meiothermus sp. PNK-Is4]
MSRYEVIVVGGGHAGIEAAWAAAQVGARVGLITSNPERIGLMPCNPAVGGPGKSQLVAEVVAMGGLMGRLADATAIHTRVLNRSKGPAVQSLRVQVDRDAYALEAQRVLLSHPRIESLRAEVAALWVEGGELWGVLTVDGRKIQASSVVVASGTFLSGVVWYGRQSRPAGRQGEPPARFLSQSIRAVGHRMLRFKTGTPPRIRADSVDYAALEVVPPDVPPQTFAGVPGPHAAARPTWQTRTTEATHRLIRENLHLSPLYGGDIEGIGPRYCPSIEDKVVRFADKETHLLFVEPDGLETSELYLQGFSSSLPPQLQERMVRTLPGFEKAVIQRYAYAVEYDAVDATELTAGLQSQKLPGLFTAGQINGTSGYEEAAAQGLIAGLNAARFARGQEEIRLSRESGYIGVMIDDLVHRGTDEPYRMMTSRVELRLLCRADNADERLLPLATEVGLRTPGDLEKTQEKYRRIQAELERLGCLRLEGVPALLWLRRPEVTYADLVARLGPSPLSLSEEEIEQVEIRAKYAGYIQRQQKLSERLKELASYHIPPTLEYRHIPSLSKEAVEKLSKIRPATVAEASRVPGVRDSDLTALLVYLSKGRVPA